MLFFLVSPSLAHSLAPSLSFSISFFLPSFLFFYSFSPQLAVPQYTSAQEAECLAMWSDATFCSDCITKGYCTPPELATAASLMAGLIQLTMGLFRLGMHAHVCAPACVPVRVCVCVCVCVYVCVCVCVQGKDRKIRRRMDEVQRERERER